MAEILVTGECSLVVLFVLRNVISVCTYKEFYIDSEFRARFHFQKFSLHAIWPVRKIFQNFRRRQHSSEEVVRLFGNNLHQINNFFPVAFFEFSMSIIEFLSRFPPSISATEKLFGRKFREMQQDTFYSRPAFEGVKFHQNSCFSIVYWTIQDGQIATKLQLARKWDICTRVFRQSQFFVKNSVYLTIFFKKKLKDSCLFKVYTLKTWNRYQTPVERT